MSDKYIFIDRDGVINKDPGGWTEYGYVTKWEDFHFLPGVLEALKKIKDAGYKGVLISNQQGVGKGNFTEEELDEVTSKMITAIEAAGGSIAGVYYCVHKKEENCDCRKPRSGLFLRAKKDLEMRTLEDKYFIGDNKSDIEAGMKIDLKTIFVCTGKFSQEDAETWEYKPEYICKDLSEAVNLVLSEE